MARLSTTLLQSRSSTQHFITVLWTNAVQKPHFILAEQNGFYQQSELKRKFVFVGESESSPLTLTRSVAESGRENAFQKSKNWP